MTSYQSTSFFITYFLKRSFYVDIWIPVNCHAYVCNRSFIYVPISTLMSYKSRDNVSMIRI